MSSEERERWKRYDGYARRVITCVDEECTLEDHIRNLRFLMLNIYDDGYTHGKRETAEYLLRVAEAARADSLASETTP